MRTLILPAAVALALAAPAARPDKDDKKDKPENLVTNGSFEDGPDADPFVPLDEKATTLKGWEVTRGQIDLVGNYWKAAEGKKSLDLHGSPGLGGVKQTFKTTKGKKYTVSFSLAANPDRSVKTRSLTVEAAGAKETFKFEAENTKEEMGWVTKSWTFTAAGDETTLEFYTAETEDASCGPALDNVLVTAAAEKKEK